MIRRFLQKQPFTLFGFIFFVVIIFILIRSLSSGNMYEIVLAAGALLFLSGLGFSGLWARRKLTALEPLWKPPVPLTAVMRGNGSGSNAGGVGGGSSSYGGNADKWQVSCSVSKLPLFYRLHFLLRGSFLPQGTSLKTAVFSQCVLGKNMNSAIFNLDFPLGGILQGKGSLRLRDVFGIFSFYTGSPYEQVLTVRSSPSENKPFRIQPASGAEDRRNKSSTDEERYYMREYAPGDRLRDINWKSSEKIDTLITRISPDNQEKVSLIEIVFRNYGPKNPSIGDLWLLDRAKARLCWFINTLAAELNSLGSGAGENINYIFHISCEGREWELQSMDEIDSFPGELAALSFAPVNAESPPMPSADKGDIYIFSTSCDTGLPAFLLSKAAQKTTLFLSHNFVPKGEENHNTALLRLSDFPALGFLPLSAGYIHAQLKNVNVNYPGVLLDYALIKI